MDANLQAVLLFHNHQTITPQVPFTGRGVATMAAPAEEPPPMPAPAPAPEKEQPGG